MQTKSRSWKQAILGILFVAGLGIGLGLGQPHARAMLPVGGGGGGCITCGGLTSTCCKRVVEGYVFCTCGAWNVCTSSGVCVPPPSGGAY